MENDRTTTLLTILVAISMLAVTVPTALATHNSVGTGLAIAEANQVDADGTTNPDVPEHGYVDRHANVYETGLSNAYGSNLSEDLPPRPGPADQTGASYTDDCRTFSSFVENNDGTVEPQTEYRHHLPNWAEEEIMGDEFEKAGDDDFFGDENKTFADGVALPSDDAISDAPSDACYVGFLDTETVYASILPFAPTGGDIIYPLNPDPNDEDCGGPVDYIQGLLGLAEDVDCSGSGHGQYIFSSWTTFSIDTDLVEAGFGGNDATPTHATEVFETDERDWTGSGTISLPYSYTHQFFLFGYPHPATPQEDRGQVTATDDVWNLPFHGVPDQACGLHVENTARTPSEDECRMLSPRDLTLYDNDPDGFAEASDLPAENRGRLCDLAPDFNTVNDFDPADRTCGPFGDPVTTFIDISDAGGVLVDQEGNPEAAPTYINTLPGWKSSTATLLQNAHFAPANMALGVAFNSTANAENAFDRLLVTVNPEVPTFDGKDPWCIEPQIMTDGATISDYEGTDEDGNPQTWEDWVQERITEIQESDDYDHNEHDGLDSDVEVFFDTEFETIDHFGGTDDPIPGDASGTNALGDMPAIGVYGAYQSAAVDTDMRPSVSTAVITGGVQEGHGIPGYDGTEGEVYPVIDDLFDIANDVANDADGTVEDVLDETDETPVDDELAELLDTIAEATEDAGALADTLLEAVLGAEDQLTPLASSDPDPARLPGDQNIDPFDRPQNEGIACNGAGALTFSEEGASFDGVTNFGNDVQRFALPNMQDPTLTDGDGDPAKESESTGGTWEANWYSFSGDSFVYVDNTQNGGFSGCDTGGGSAPNPDADQCVYDLPWSNAQEENNFTVEDPEDGSPYGNGLVSSIEVTGTALFFRTDVDPADQAGILDEAQLVNDADPSQTTCVVLTSGDFHEKLPSHLDDHDQWDESAASEFCSGNEERVLTYEGAFSSSSTPAGYNAFVEWIKVTPTPDATQDFVNTENDALCTTAVFTTASDEIASGTKDNIRLGDGTDTSYYTHCESLHQAHLGDDYDQENFVHPLTGLTTDLPDFSDKSPAWASS